ncbi:hypothetical protein RvY_14801 [Ramazzottius varieornatus]|uniref:Uncharacterized protein n=1 Tax=Ramazzottius varieornatus TaxID=947166 RepID=A0A1D1VW95_RAMVA|nr:hypothetical protein RvY_14801 [Ramazzottius varieornatus]
MERGRSSVAGGSDGRRGAVQECGASNCLGRTEERTDVTNVTRRKQKAFERL